MTLSSTDPGPSAVFIISSEHVQLLTRFCTALIIGCTGFRHEDCGQRTNLFVCVLGRTELVQLKAIVSRVTQMLTGIYFRVHGQSEGFSLELATNIRKNLLDKRRPECTDPKELDQNP